MNLHQSVAAASSTGTPACARLKPHRQITLAIAIPATLLLLISIAFANRANAQTPTTPTTPTPQKPLTPEASLNLRFLSDLQLSPDGTRLAFVVTEPPTDDGRATHIWLYDKRTNTTRQFTYSKKSEKWPRWSPDGKQLAFLSNRNEEDQIYAMRADGGEAIALTKGKRGIARFEWSPSSQQIAFLAPDAKPKPKKRKKKTKTTPTSTIKKTSTPAYGC